MMERAVDFGRSMLCSCVYGPQPSSITWPSASGSASYCPNCAAWRSLWSVISGHQTALRRPSKARRPYLCRVVVVAVGRMSLRRRRPECRLPLLRGAPAAVIHAHNAVRGLVEGAHVVLGVPLQTGCTRAVGHLLSCRALPLPPAALARVAAASIAAETQADETRVVVAAGTELFAIKVARSRTRARTAAAAHASACDGGCGGRWWRWRVVDWFRWRRRYAVRKHRFRRLFMLAANPFGALHTLCTVPAPNAEADPKWQRCWRGGRWRWRRSVR